MKYSYVFTVCLNGIFTFITLLPTTYTLAKRIWYYKYAFYILVFLYFFTQSNVLSAYYLNKFENLPIEFPKYLAGVLSQWEVSTTIFSVAQKTVLVIAFVALITERFLFKKFMRRGEGKPRNLHSLLKLLLFHLLPLCLILAPYFFASVVFGLRETVCRIDFLTENQNCISNKVFFVKTALSVLILLSFGGWIVFDSFFRSRIKEDTKKPLIQKKKSKSKDKYKEMMKSLLQLRTQSSEEVKEPKSINKRFQKRAFASMILLLFLFECLYSIVLLNNSKNLHKNLYFDFYYLSDSDPEKDVAAKKKISVFINKLQLPLILSSMFLNLFVAFFFFVLNRMNNKKPTPTVEIKTFEQRYQKFKETNVLLYFRNKKMTESNLLVATSLVFVKNLLKKLEFLIAEKGKYMVTGELDKNSLETEFQARFNKRERSEKTKYRSVVGKAKSNIIGTFTDELVELFEAEVHEETIEKEIEGINESTKDQMELKMKWSKLVRNIEDKRQSLLNDFYQKINKVELEENEPRKNKVYGLVTLFFEQEKQHIGALIDAAYEFALREAAQDREIDLVGMLGSNK